jgi:hypothetical protein
MGEERKCTSFWWKNLKERDHLKVQGVDGLKLDLREIGWEGVVWIHLAHDKDQWQALVNMMINLWVLAPWN